MTDHYAILGLNKNATDLEIKAAFRKLAKIYHPDKGLDNPDAKAIFEKILKAYNVLINPVSRRRYDHSFSYSSTQQQYKQKPKNKQQKDWNFTEEELKRRQYYQQHYKAKQQTTKPKPTEKPYSDYKYILYATPLAVALLMLIISLFTKKPNSLEVTNKTNNNIVIGKLNQRVNGDKPYSGYFGQIKIFDTQNSIRINNSSSFDAVIVLFDAKTNQYIQHSYLQNMYYVEFSKLPDDGVYWKCMIGKNWNENKILFNEKVTGAFDSIAQYQNRKESPTTFNTKQENEIEMLDIITPNSKYKSYISNEKDFFTK